MGFDNERALARELVILAGNDADLYRQRVQPIQKNLKRKLDKGIFQRELAEKLVKYLMDDTAKRNTQHYGKGAFSPDVRRLASAIWVEEFLYEESLLDNYNIYHFHDVVRSGMRCGSECFDMTRSEINANIEEQGESEEFIAWIQSNPAIGDMFHGQANEILLVQRTH
jgi:hypothetical protein